MAVWVDTHGSLARALPSLTGAAPGYEPPPGAPPVETQRLEAHSFEALYAAHAAFTWRTLRHLGIAPMAVDDAMQELWVVVHRRLSEFEGRSDVKTWLFGIAANVARNGRRTARRRPEGTPLPVALAAADSDPARGEERAEAFALVQGFLGTLDEQRSQVFVCALLEGWSALETAKATGLDEVSVQNRVRALRRSFKTWIERKRRER
jgi:RNA polymerase sigma-70 factor (ECF subfamily)